MDTRAAINAIDEAINALSIEVWVSIDGASFEPSKGLENTIAVELDRIDRAIGKPGQSMFAPIADSIRHAVIALHEARAALQD